MHSAPTPVSERPLSSETAATPVRAFVVPNDEYMDDILGRTIAGSTVVGKWRKAYDLSQLTKEAASAPAGFNTIGWNSSYTRQPIPREEIPMG